MIFLVEKALILESILTLHFYCIASGLSVKHKFSLYNVCYLLFAR